MELRDRGIVRLGARTDFFRRCLVREKDGEFFSHPSGSLQIRHLRDVTVRLARTHEWPTWDRLMNEPHHLGFKRFAGRGLRYVAAWRGQ